ncbi:MAG: DeoR/GlpR family DNA-binding transcription regulator [Lachnospiraceae bacterium]|nr:DeoR/GlpR family DNA-binding transcription regulator [Lachnospiraceae bacterium]
MGDTIREGINENINDKNNGSIEENRETEKEENNRENITLTGVGRRQEILRQLQEEGNVSVTALAEKFQVSAMTIRRDLYFFEKQGALETNYGGAHLPQERIESPDFSTRNEQMISNKRAIGRKAGSFMREGDVIFLDAGSTVLQIAKYFPDIHATVITTSIPVVQYLSSNSKIKLVVAPGIYRRDAGGTLSIDTIEYLKKYYVKKSFISALACSPEGGVMAIDELDCYQKQIMWENSRESFLLADHTKFQQYAPLLCNKLEDYSYILTDQDMEKGIQEKVRAVNQELILC